ncbi:MAG: hypothetical protein ABSH06_04720 [Thermodesulfobacteriota bacterium]|jgi:hypothetical protein
MKIVWTKHAEDRQRQWEKKLEITRQEVENMIRRPEQIVAGDQNTLVAQSKRGNGLLRVAFGGVGGDRKILTLYWTSKVQKYWKE